ncbi:MAG: HD domain-containing protein [Dehalococcoidia bacterium]|nr:MAG: HD domain-containing protein [Dehalococcoidia bacterium]
MPLSECTRVCASLARALHVIDSISSSSYVVGGFIRDSFLGRVAKDIDVVVPGDAMAIAQQVARELGGSFVPLDQEHCIARVVQTWRSRGESDTDAPEPDVLVIDFARYTGSIEEDLARRDFTIDAIAVPSTVVVAKLSAQGTISGDTSGSIIDPLGGLRDISERRLRACSAGAFEDDPGRLLRAVRLARELGFTIDVCTESAIREHAHLVSGVAAERTREELLKLLSLPDSAAHVHYLDTLGLLVPVFPELERCRDVEQPTCHFWDVLEHSIQTIATFEFITEESDWKYGNDEMVELVPDDPSLRMYLAARVSFEASRATLIKVACLLHDIAKPQTKTIEDSGRARFLGHATEGASLARDILQRLRFSSHETAFVESLVCHHLRPSQMSAEGLPTRRAVYRFFRDTSSAGIGVLHLAMADYLACRGPLFTMTEWRSVCELIDFILQEHARQEATVAPTRLIDGSELMQALGMQPGPSVGVLLEAIREAQAAGLVNLREDALKLARRIFESEHFTVRTSK